jgi:hypothetical protein
MELIRMRERVSIRCRRSQPFRDVVCYRPTWRITQRDAEGNVLSHVEERGNMLLTTGGTELAKLFSGGSATAYGSNAKLGVGDSNTAESAAQTDLQAASNKLYKTVSGAPVQTGAKVLFSADFNSGEAEYKWKEVALKNNGSVVFNRHVNTTDPTNGWGDKSASPGTVWTLELEIEFGPG